MEWSPGTSHKAGSEATAQALMVQMIKRFEVSKQDNKTVCA